MTWYCLFILCYFGVYCIPFPNTPPFRDVVVVPTPSPSWGVDASPTPPPFQGTATTLTSPPSRGAAPLRPLFLFYSCFHSNYPFCFYSTFLYFAILVTTGRYIEALARPVWLADARHTCRPRHRPGSSRPVTVMRLERHPVILLTKEHSDRAAAAAGKQR